MIQLIFNTFLFEKACMIDAALFSDYCVGNLELIVIIKIVYLNNQKGSFDIPLPGKTN